jgi:cellulose synthase/poly-beta-1,6-N-acetylglucosamine synthase-like glycosyltransferase
LNTRFAQSIGLWALVALTLGSAALYLSGSDQFWLIFTAGYISLLIVYTGYVLALVLIHDLRPRIYPEYAGQRIAVLIPCFNEEHELLERSIRSVFAAKGNKQVIVIDDGSTNGILPRLHELTDELRDQTLDRQRCGVRRDDR